MPWAGSGKARRLLVGRETDFMQTRSNHAAAKLSCCLYNCTIHVDMSKFFGLIYSKDTKRAKPRRCADSCHVKTHEAEFTLLAKYSSAYASINGHGMGPG